MKLIGLDIGTTSCKAGVFREDGALLAVACREYGILVPEPGWAEQDAELVWNLAREALREAVRDAGSDGIGALGLSVQGEAVIPVDRRGIPLRPAILGMDMRTIPQNQRLEEKFGSRALHERTGMPILTVNTLPKLKWLRDRDPAVWEQAHAFRLYEDFLAFRLAGRALISRNLASRTQCCELRSGGWSGDLLAWLGLGAERLSPIADSGTPVGPLLPEIAESLGLDARRPPLVVLGGHDAACGALGAGITRPGLAMDITGTAEVVEVALSDPSVPEALTRSRISVYPHVLPGLYLAMTLNHSGGIALRWFRDALCGEEIQAATRACRDAYDLVLDSAPDGPSPLLFMPHLSGSGTPVYDSASKGTLLGITPATRKSDIAKAILEGLCFELRLALDALAEGGIPVTELRAVGGGAKSELWLQLKSAITGRTVSVPRVTEAAGLGAAVLAGVGAGFFREAGQTMDGILEIRRRLEASPEERGRYEPRYRLYSRLYPAVREINGGL